LPNRTPSPPTTLTNQQKRHNILRYLYKIDYICNFNKEKPMNRIKEVLETKGIKQTWLAEQLGKSYNMVNAYVQNRQQPRLEDLYRIAEILGVDVKELIRSKTEIN